MSPFVSYADLIDTTKVRASLAKCGFSIHRYLWSALRDELESERIILIIQEIYKKVGQMALDLEAMLESEQNVLN